VRTRRADGDQSALPTEPEHAGALGRSRVPIPRLAGNQLLIYPVALD